MAKDLMVYCRLMKNWFSFLTLNLSRSFAIGFLLLSVSVYTQAQTTLFSENFDDDNSTLLDLTGPSRGPISSGDGNYDISVTGSDVFDSGDYFKLVSSGANRFLEGRDVNGNLATLETRAIDISGYTATIEVDFSETGDMEDMGGDCIPDVNATDYIILDYRVDGGPWTVADPDPTCTGFTLIGNFTSATASQGGITGTSLEIRIRFQNWASDERIQINEIRVTGTLPTCAAPINDATSLALTPNGSGTAMDIAWNKNGAENVLVQISTDATFDLTPPADGVVPPAANAAFNGTTDQWVYAGNGTSVNVTGLSACTGYHVKVWSYNCVSLLYKATSNAIANVLSSTETPTVSLVSDFSDVCSGEDVVFTATGAFGNTTTRTFEFLDQNDNVLQAASLLNTYAASNLTADTMVKVRMNAFSNCLASTANGTPVSSLVSVTVNRAQITTEPSVSAVCAGASLTLSPVYSGNNLSHQWQLNTGSGFADIPTAISPTLSLSNLTAAQNGHQYQVQVRSNNACETFSIPVTLNIEPTISIPTQPLSAATRCELEALNLSVVASGGLAPLNYQWTKDDVPIGTNNAMFTVASLVLSSSGTYKVQVSSSGLCPAVTSVLVPIQVLPIARDVTFSGLEICEGEEVRLTINSSVVGNTYQALLGAQALGSALQGTGAALNYTFESSALSIGSNEIGLQIVGCGSSLVSANTAEIEVLARPTADAGQDQEFQEIVEVTLDGSNSTQGAGIEYQWTSLNESEISNATAILTTALPVGNTNAFELTVRQASLPSCSARDEVIITVPIVEVKVPNAFSPNGDGNHDVFLIENIELFPSATLEIYSQWGELIYKSEAPANNPWNGLRNNSNGEMPTSAYYYVIELNKAGSAPLSGHINLIR